MLYSITFSSLGISDSQDWKWRSITGYGNGQTAAFIMALAVVLRGTISICSCGKDYASLEAISELSTSVPAMIEQLVMRAGMIIYVKTVASLELCNLCNPPNCYEYSGNVFHEWPSLCGVSHLAGRPEPG